MEKKALKAVRSGKLKIGGTEIECAVLNDKNNTRVLSRATFVRAIGRKGKVKGGRKYDDEFKTPVFLTAQNLKPFIPGDLDENSKPIFYEDSGKEHIGYRADFLPQVCGIFIDASDAGVLKSTQQHIADTCKVLLRGFATVGIVALVDEATGYQDIRARDELNQILEAFIAKELLPWAKKFPDEFYKELFRLRGWKYVPFSVKRPQYVGKLTNELIYDRLPPGIKGELQKKNPVVNKETGTRRHRHHQYLTREIGHPFLDKLLAGTIALMRASGNWRQFKRMFERSYPKPEVTQLELPGIEEE